MTPVPARAPWTVSFAATVNALSIPLIAGILVWVLDRVLSPSDWCPALEDFKTAAGAGAAVLRCKDILLAQVQTGHFVAIGLVAALSLSHLVSVVREAKAGFDLQTGFGGFRIGGDDAPLPDAAAGARHVAEAADEAKAEVEQAAEPKPTTQEGELP